MTKKCPYCFESVLSSAARCRSCGRELEVRHTVAPPSRTKSYDRSPTGKSDPSVHPVTGETIRPRPTSYLVWAILLTVLFFSPFGIAAIVYAARVDIAYNCGLISESYRLSRIAAGWTIVSVIWGVLLFVAVYYTN